jgi:hypothetical protein
MVRSGYFIDRKERKEVQAACNSRQAGVR